MQVVPRILVACELLLILAREVFHSEGNEKKTLAVVRRVPDFFFFQIYLHLTKSQKNTRNRRKSQQVRRTLKKCKKIQLNKIYRELMISVSPEESQEIFIQGEK